ncbi:MAG: DUF3667 domain-containing protein [Novosphingobium sp.]
MSASTPTEHGFQSAQVSEGSGDGHTHESACLNCGTVLVGSHCHACGQHAHVHRTLGAFVHDLAHGVLHVEGKVWRTLPLLVWRPGRLTREYIDGRRASYLSPIALFLFAVFLLFATYQTIGPEAKARADTATSTGTPSDRVVVSTGVRFIDHGVEVFRSNPDLALYKLQSSAYKYSWILIPISLPFLWLLFPFSARFGLYDHAVFVTYSLAFMTLLAVLQSLVDAAGIRALAGAGLVIPPFHIYRQVKEAYELSRASALWRTVALVVMAGAALAIFALALAAMSLGE